MEWIVERVHENQDNPEDTLMNFGTLKITNCAGSTAKKAGSVDPSHGIAVDMLNGSNGVGATTVIDGKTVTVTWKTH